MTWARECEHCGGPIPDHRRIDAMYCGRACKESAHRALLAAGRLEDKASRPPCLHCRAPIPPEAPAHREFCDATCQRRFRYLQEIEARPVQTCPTCGTRFHPVHQDRPQTYCSHRCAQVVYREAPRPCVQCGTVIDAPRQQQRYCCKRCKMDAKNALRRSG